MKNLLILALAFVASSFTVSNTFEKKVDINSSKITWKGKKVTGEHDGHITLNNGTLLFDANNNLIGGTFAMNMKTITVTDLKGEMKNNLENHLKSDDFFGVERHNQSTLVMTKVTGSNGAYKVTGDLTIKGITNPITFDMAVSGHTATAKLKIDRTKYDIKFRSSSFFDNLKDKAIYDNFDLNVNLKF